MTRWKKQIDHELGSEAKFTSAVKERIIQKAAATEPKKDWKAGIAAAGIVFIALLLVLSSPYEQERKMQPSKSLEQVLKETKAKEFFISGLPSNEEKFIAKDSEFYLGNKKYDKQEDVQFIQSLLESVSVYEGDRFSEGRDILIHMEDGEQLKLKLYPYDSFAHMGIKDMETGLFYTVTNNAIWDFYYNYQPRINGIGFYFLSFLLAGLNLFVEHVLLKRYHGQKKRKQFQNKWHLITMGVLATLVIIGLVILSTGSIAVHKGGMLAALLLVLSVNYAFDKKYEIDRVYRKINLIHSIARAGIIALMVLWL